MQHYSLMHDGLFAACLTMLNILLTLYILKPKKSTFRLIYWVCMLFFISIYPISLVGYQVQIPRSSGLMLGLAFMITVTFSMILFFSVCWVWVIRRSFSR
ncbi:hypothetical protein J2X07_002019 [Fictibacillus barbaricus]|uniref:Uncharacterized protein n=1 Tax=Fictibacillus barbaricus TaxID=182136 RepID=A0ABU1U0U1_9BACL|nr:hypothetical protein [Fictibacillus barbaricus]